MAHALNLVRKGWGRFGQWRRTRPFWGGVLLVAAGIELLVAPAAQSLVIPIDLIIYAGIAGISGGLIALLLISLGVLSWLQPAQHVFFGVTGVLLALVSYVTSNFGGFVIGMLLGIVGGALVFAWGPKTRRPRRRDRAAAAEETAGEAADHTGEETAEEKSAGEETVERPEGTGARPSAAVALPLAALLLLSSAPAPHLSWPWDWLLPGEEASEEPVDPSPSPSAEPTEPGPGEDPGDPGTGDPGDGEPGADDPEKEEGEDGEPDGEPEEDGEEGPEEDTEEADPADCELRAGPEAVADSEEEFLEVVRACQAALEEGELPDVPMDEGYDCFRGSVRTSGLTSDVLTMYGAGYDGVVECPTADGPQRYIRLTMSRAVFDDAELWFEDAGTRMSLGLPRMTMEGDVVMHVTRMEIRLLGIPLTFTPDFPPPLLLPFMIVTDVDVAAPTAGTDTMDIPALNGNYGG
ncbi:DUF6114 domain-containing protein [Nocardiopsis algeriensis]|uniref:DUF6114 domain-containing protein n=1 Tax=Nocardiopsis algeriensis TaxID=1478215 RepID=UPI003B42C292